MDINNLAISERTPVGSVIYTLEGSDPENGPVHFGLEGTDVLKVNSNTGAVTVVKPLDYEVGKSCSRNTLNPVPTNLTSFISFVLARPTRPCTSMSPSRTRSKEAATTRSQSPPISSSWTKTTTPRASRM
jgi:hypothetical protein